VQQPRPKSFGITVVPSAWAVSLCVVVTTSTAVRLERSGALTRLPAVLCTSFLPRNTARHKSLEIRSLRGHCGGGAGMTGGKEATDRGVNSLPCKGMDLGSTIPRQRVLSLLVCIRSTDTDSCCLSTCLSTGYLPVITLLITSTQLV
jgi:hypothetical protein